MSREWHLKRDRSFRRRLISLAHFNLERAKDKSSRKAPVFGAN
jgi:hypothetical protein